MFRGHVVDTNCGTHVASALGASPATGSSDTMLADAQSQLDLWGATGVALGDERAVAECARPSLAGSLRMHLRKPFFE